MGTKKRTAGQMTATAEGKKPKIRRPYDQIVADAKAKAAARKVQWEKAEAKVTDLETRYAKQLALAELAKQDTAELDAKEAEAKETLRLLRRAKKVKAA